MKHIFNLSIIAIILIFTSCTKDDCPSTCGTISDDGIDGDCYWLEIRNECTDNKKTFCFDQDVWMDNFVGDSFCVTGVDPW